MFRNILLFILVLGVSAPIAPSSWAQEGDPEMPEALSVLAERGAQSRYLGVRHGMQGWVTMFKGQEQYYYVTPDGQGFLMGLLFDKDGQMATINQVRELQKNSDDALDILWIIDIKNNNRKFIFLT